MSELAGLAGQSEVLGPCQPGALIIVLRAHLGLSLRPMARPASPLLLCLLLVAGGWWMSWAQAGAPRVAVVGLGVGGVGFIVGLCVVGLCVWCVVG